MEYMDKENPERVFYKHEIQIDAFLPETEPHPDWFKTLIEKKEACETTYNAQYCYSIGLNKFGQNDRRLHVPRGYYLCRVVFYDTSAAIQNRYGRVPENTRKIGDLFYLSPKCLSEQYVPYDGRFQKSGYYDTHIPKSFTVSEEIANDPEIESRFRALGLSLKAESNLCDIFQGEKIVKESLQGIAELMSFLEGCELGSSLRTIKKAKK